MIGNLFNNYYESAAMIIFCVGLSILLFDRNLVKKIIGFNIMDTAIYLFLAAKGYIRGRMAPIIADGVQDAAHYINPIPAGLVLTGIVVSVSVTAVSLALVIRLYEMYGSLNMDRIIFLSREEAE